MVREIWAFSFGVAIGLALFWDGEGFARWVTLDCHTLKPVASFYTRAAARDYASQLNDEEMLAGYPRRYHAVHKSFMRGW
jgi:hypothetical protein